MLIVAAAFFVVVLFFLLLGGRIGGASGEFQALPQSFVVEGHLIAAPSGSFGGAPVGSFAGGVLVPGVTTWLRNPGTHKLVGRPVRTNLSGRFLFVKVRIGRYQVCWKARGFVIGCGKAFSVGKENLYLGALRIAVQQAPGRKTFFGAVRFADKSLTRTYEPLAHVNAFAVVRGQTFVRTRKKTRPGPTTRAYVNNAGEYILPAVAVGVKVSVRASIEATASAASFTPTALAAASSKRINFTFKNSPPTIQGIVATAPGGTHWTAAPGDTVQLKARARDPNGNPLRFRWNMPDGSSTLVAGGGGTTSFHLAGPGTYEFEVVASDGRGGYAKETLKLSTSGVRFAGTVSATNAPVVPGAVVEINGKTVTTDSTGRFSLYVPESARYVLNIRKEGYGLVSRIYDNGLTGGQWILTRASVTPVDPTLPINVTNRRQPSDCPGSFSDQAERKNKPHDCRPGIRVEIPADALVDADGNAPAGPVDVALTTVDLGARDAMPGDFTSVDPAGNQRVMESYGAGTIDITAGTKRYNLAPGKSAQVTIPIDAKQLAAPTPPAPTIPLLSYDEGRGIWVEEGTATRVGNSYVGTVTHFSAVNMDQQKTNQACVRLDATIMPTKFDLEVTVPTSSGSPFTKTISVTNENQRFHVVYNLPTSSMITLRAWDTTGTAPVAIQFSATVPPTTPPTSVPSITVPTGGPQTPSSPNLPAFPYDACKVTQELVPFRLPPEVRRQFLEGLSFAADNITELENQGIGDPATIRAKANLYYDTIDPQGKRTTLTGFTNTNGFTGTPGTDEAQAFYVNAGDLGFGRDMNCHRNGADVACYVSNYGDRFTDDVQDFKDAVDRKAAAFVATVGMEYSRVELPCPSGPPCPTGFQQVAGGGGDLRIVKFYVWDKTGTRVEAANLDGFGQRPVPALCMVCHGGQITVGSVTGNRAAPLWDKNDANSANLNSRFIAFDVGSFRDGFPAAAYNGHDQSSEEPKFKTLNQDFVWNTNPPQALRDIIIGMYGAPPPGGSTPQNTSFIVSGWPGSGIAAQTYTDVVGPSCRNCHTSLAPSSLDWTTSTKFEMRAPAIDNAVCTFHYMPHSKVTHNRFWLSLAPHQPPILNTFLTSVFSDASNNCNL
jgi:hypothetical protein